MLLWFYPGPVDRRKVGAVANSSGIHGFDWLFGRWTVANRKLRARLSECTEWQEFEADYEAWPILRGLGNQDRFETSAFGEPFEGMSIRYYDPLSDRWKIHWLDSWAVANGRPKLAESMVGGMRDGRGEFFGTSEWEGRSVEVRFRWAALDEWRARWDQAFSVDEKESWEVNWVMEFTRRDT